MMRRLLLSTLCVLTFSSAALAQDELAGFDEIAVTAEHRLRPMAGSVWYPVGTKTYKGLVGDNAVFKGRYVYVGAGVKDGKYPLVLFSHGSGGNMLSLSWLLTELAKKGAVVVAVNHPGSTSGDSSPRRSILMEDRAKDLSAALDTILADPNFAPYIDTTQIIAAGFSLGGSTVMNMAGGRWDRDAYNALCDRYGDAEGSCVFFAKGGVDFSRLSEKFIGDAKDERISAAIAIDPGFTMAFEVASASNIDVPVQFINIGQDTRWFATDLEHEDNTVLSAISQVTYDVVDQGDHFSFLPECKPNGAAILEAEQDDPVCDDPEGTDRAAVHKQIVDFMAEFIGLN